MIHWNPISYHSNTPQLEKWAKELLAKLSLQGTERLLDIGSGDGRVTAEISKLLPNGSVVGIDSSPEMIRFSQDKFNNNDYPNLKFHLMDMNAIQFENEFNAVFSTATLHWVIDHLTVLQQIKKCLRTPSKLYLQMGGQGNQSELIKFVVTVAKSDRWQPFFNNFVHQYGYYGIEEYQEWLTNIGFIAKRLELIPKDNALSGKEGLDEWIKLAFSPYVQRLPTGLQDSFINDIATGYITKYPCDEQGLYHIKMVRLEVEAYLH